MAGLLGGHLMKKKTRRDQESPQVTIDKSFMRLLFVILGHRGAQEASVGSSTSCLHEPSTAEELRRKHLGRATMDPTLRG